MARLPSRAAWTKRSPPVLRQALREIRERFPASASKTIVVQWARRRRARDAGNRPEIFVDGPQVMVR